MGKSMLMSDGLIVLASGIIFGINNMMYSILMLYIISLISDRVVLGVSDNKMFMIVTNKEDEIRSLPTLDYIQLTVQKEVQQGLLEVARKKPKKPIKFLGEYLVQKSKNNSLKLAIWTPATP